MGVSGAFAAVLGLLPHVLHHAGILAGALFAGFGGSLLFGAIGFAAAVPFLLRVRRRSGGWRVPAGLLALFAVMFSVSTFVIGPAIGDGGDKQPSSSQTAPPASEQPANGKGPHGHH